MIKVLLIVPYNEIREQFEKIFSQYDTNNIQLETTHIFGTTDEMIRSCDADIVIVRGITALAVRSALPHITVVDISTNGDDILSALVSCQERDHQDRVAVITPQNVHFNLRDIEALSGIGIRHYLIRDEADADSALLDAKANGITTLVGGLTVCRKGEANGFRTVHIKTGSVTIERAVSEAINAANTMQNERTKSMLIKTMLDNAREAMVAVDSKGRIIAITEQSYRLFGLSHTNTLLGEHISALHQDIEWSRGLETTGEEESVKTIGDKLMLVVRWPMQQNGVAMGALYSFQNANKIREVENKIRKATSVKGLTARYCFDDIIHCGVTMEKCIAMAYRYSAADSNVLILGETGTGKELFAQSIHNASRRAAAPFVAVNCAALPEHLLESELFGYSEGSFSGAVKGGKQGLFELAHGGTIFLDEIGEMPTNLQAKLLRVLQEQEVRRIGDDKVIPIDVRVLSATNINIRKKVEQGVFREDLFYRINVLILRIPPLRERVEDIRVLCEKLVEGAAQQQGTHHPIISERAMARLECYRWRGNVRELRNFCERLVALSGGSFVDEELAVELAAFSQDEEATPVLRKSKQQLAQELGISRTTLWRMNKLKKQQDETI